MIPPIGAQVKPLGIVSDRPRHAIAGFAPLVSQFPSARWVADSLENALVDSPDPANGIIGASAPLRLAGRACSRVDSKIVLIVRDREHQLLGPFVARLLGQDAGFFRSPVPLFGAVEVLRCNGHGTHP